MTARQATRPATLAVVAALAACGGRQEPPQKQGTEGGGAPAPATRPVETVEVRETDFAIDPPNVRIQRPGKVRFRVDNAGRAPHALEIEGPEGEVETKVLQSGDSATLTADLSKPGRYKWYCPVGDHEQKGMKGTVTVG
ncbi:MAG TPA: cupredoxin domain-containing protein [Thermoleophilaceae bacterium]|nr:cupredoxin domain-containing protein [Thermoleophilaceae bacterium]